VYALSNFTCAGGPLYNTTARTGNVATTANTTGVPTGYYNAAAGLTCSALKTALKTIITNGHNPQTYDDLWSQYQNTDIKPRPTGSGNVIWDIYSTRADGTAPYYYVPGSDQCGSYNGEGSCYNREHSFPKSWFNDEMPAYSDYNHIFPTDGYVNGKRSNYKYGEVATATWTSQIGAKLGSSSIAGIAGPVFEPIDEYKGDVARAYLYMITRYQDRITTWDGYSTEGAETFVANTFPSVEINYLKLMLKWHHQDPVSAKEIARNNGTYSFQGNRNPYIDDATYADQVWNNTCPGLSALPVDVLYFGGKLLGDKVTLNWEVANETNVERYVVERSFNGSEFSITGSLTATGKTRYTFDDNISLNRGRRIYYRLKKMDKDGSFTYSEIFSIHVPMNIRFTVYPNPAKDYVVVQLNNIAQNNATLQLTDLTGRLVLQQKATSGSYTQLPVTGLPAGTYLLTLLNGAERYMQKVVITQ
jgi:endonuclease I